MHSATSLLRSDKAAPTIPAGSLMSSETGRRLMANYRKQAHACMVERADEGEGILFYDRGAWRRREA